MSKICDQVFTEAELNEAEEVLGVYGQPLCIKCKKPSALHGKTWQERLLHWAMSDDKGVSSKAIAFHMTGARGKGKFSMSPPHDASDRGRCIRLLELIPEWIPRLEEMVQHDPFLVPAIVIGAAGMEPDTNTWAKQIPLIHKEGEL